MILQPFLVACFAGIFIYSWMQGKYSLFISRTLCLLCVAGAILTLLPGLTTRAANLLGVGRGADLALYLYVPISLLLIVNLSARIRQQHLGTTRIVREIALIRSESMDQENRRQALVRKV